MTEKKTPKIPIELACLDFDAIKCPQCEGTVNQVWFILYDFITGRAHFLAQCWSGGEGIDHYHIFKVTVDVNYDLKVEAKKP